MKKNTLENVEVKGEITQNEQFHIFPQCFLCNLYLEILNSHISVVVCSFFNVGSSQNGVLGYTLMLDYILQCISILGYIYG